MEKKYLLDGDIVDWTYLIDKACEYDFGFADSVIKTTSSAAKILRDNGHVVQQLRTPR